MRTLRTSGTTEEAKRKGRVPSRPNPPPSNLRKRAKPHRKIPRRHLKSRRRRTRPSPNRKCFSRSSKVILPEIVGKDRALKEIILQTEVVLELPPEYAPQLPPILAWTPDPRQLESGMVVEPGHQQPETIERWELPEQVSQLAAPNQETILAELSVARRCL